VRTLIYVPIIHAESDLGTMADDVRAQFEALRETHGGWERRAAAIDGMWDGIRAKLGALTIDWRRTRVYQDGLPVCPFEAQIVQDLAAKGSRNFQLLLELAARGATLMGTDSLELLVDEYRRVQRLVQAARDGAVEETPAELHGHAADTLRQRDAFIAQRIDGTLQEGETGLLFLGLLHRVDELLAGKFQVQHLIHSLPFESDVWRLLKERQQHGH
jgi:hypothetical protein